MTQQTNPRRKPIALACGLTLTALMLTGCVTSTPAVSADAACHLFKPIVLSKEDWGIMSPDLGRQIIEHDSVWDRLCSPNPVH